MKDHPLILEIKGNSLDDGPGIRSVVFFKGCPLSCIWCHNPESKQRDVEISFDSKQCIACGSCRDICTRDALSEKNLYYINRNKCDLCLECVDPCPTGALEAVGKKMNVEDIVATVVRDKPFFDTSQGGVTLSGGEPLMFMDFTSDLLKSLKAAGIHTLVETCGLFSFSAFKDKILPFCDQVYMDLKLHDTALHQQYCGTSNELILENLLALHKLSIAGNLEFLTRIPLVPGITDTDQNLSAIASFLKENGIGQVQMLNFNPLWAEKCAKVGVAYPFENKPEMQKWLEPEKLEACKSIFLKRGIEVL